MKNLIPRRCLNRVCFKILILTCLLLSFSPKIIATYPKAKKWESKFKWISSNLKIYLPLDHWEAGFNYLVEPYKLDNRKIISQFGERKTNPRGRGHGTKKIATEEFQDYVGKEIYEALALAAARIAELKFTRPIIWDNRIVFGVNFFQDDFEQVSYKKLGERGQKI